MNKLTAMDIYELCNANGWFTCGTNSQYSKLFDFVTKANIDSISNHKRAIQTIVTCIWICSDDFTMAEISNEIFLLIANKNNMFIDL